MKIYDFLNILDKCLSLVENHSLFSSKYKFSDKMVFVTEVIEAFASNYD